MGTVVVRRFDIGELRKPRRLENGWLQVDGFLTRTGIFTYRNPDGSERRELRLPEHVFDSESLASFASVPVTDEHPPVLLDAENTTKFVRGVITAQPMTIYDANLIAAMEAGKVELSCGYACELDFTPGVHNGERYDAVQKNIRGNHVAVVTKARAGETARVRMDAGDAAQVRSADEPPSKEAIMKRIRIDGVEYEVTEQVAQAFEKLLAQHAAELAASATEAQAQTQRADAAEGAGKVLAAKLDAAEKARQDAADPAKLQAAVKARVALEAEAAKFSVKCDGLTDDEIKVAVVKAASGVEVTGGEIAGAYKMAIAGAGSASLAATRAAVTVIPGARADGKPADANAARDANAKRSREAWKQTPPGAVTKK